MLHSDALGFLMLDGMFRGGEFRRNPVKKIDKIK